MSRRRLVALLAIFSIAFGALWPLVSAAKPGPREVPGFICTQSGVAQHPQAPRNAADDFHCPLCIVSADGVVPLTVAAPPVPSAEGLALEIPREAVAAVRLSSSPPPSRAPPFLP